MKTEIKVLKAMLADRSASFSIYQLAKKADAGYKIVHTAVHRLCKSGALEKKPFGGSYAISLSGRLTPSVMVAEMSRRNELLKSQNFNAIYGKMAGLKFPLMALVFGSYAKGEARRVPAGLSQRSSGSGSDMDLLVVCAKEHETAVNNALSILPLKIHLVVLTHTEFLSMANSKEFSVVSEAIKSNVILMGIEDFYRMVGHA